MTDHDALLAHILAAPDDDAPRLVMADWFDEHGQPERAELIRVQIAWARCENRGLGLDECKPREARQARERELLTANGYEWLEQGKPSPECVVRCGRESGGWAWSHHGVWTIGVEFQRGFVGRVDARGADWLQHADAILAAHPVTAVRLTTLPELAWQGYAAWIVGRSILTPCRYGPEQPELRCLKAEWPAVKAWDLPPEPLRARLLPFHAHVPDELLPRMLDEQAAFDQEYFDRVARRLGIPADLAGEAGGNRPSGR